MRELFDTELNLDDTPMSQDALVDVLNRADVLVPTITDRLDARVLTQAGENLKLIANFGAGVDNIDVVTANARGIIITNTPGVLTEDTADMAMMLMLALPRRLVEGAEVLPKAGTWPGWSPTWMLGRRLRGKALGIVGMGRIGSAVAARAKTFGLDIHYYSRNRRPPQLEERLEANFHDTLDDMLGMVDIVSLHTPLTRDTPHILSRARIGRMKPGAFVVNVSRPELIDEEALVDAIAEGRLSGAALDVFENRNGISERLLDLARQHRIVLTAHMASATLEARIEMGETVIVNIRAFVDGHQPPHRVLPDGASGKLARAQ